MEREWYHAKIDKRGRLVKSSKNPMPEGGPFKQAARRKQRLIDYIGKAKIVLSGDEKKKLKDNCKITYAVCFPKIGSSEEEYDYNDKIVTFKEAFLDASESEDHVIFGDDLCSAKKLEDKLNLIFGFKERNKYKGKYIETGNFQEKDIMSLFHKVLFNIYNIVETIDPNTHETKYIRLNEDQIRALDFLMTKKVMAVSGWAGSGKTILAIEIAKRKAMQEKNDNKILFLCINSLIKNELEKQHLSEKIVFKDIDCFTEEILDGIPLKGKESFSEDEKQQLRKLLEQTIDNEKYETVIVDEGQDYNDELKSIILYILYCITQGIDDTNNLSRAAGTLKEKVERRLRRNDDSNKQKSFYIFYDEFQTYGDGKIPEFITDIKNHFELEKNCRNTEAIVRTAFKPLTDNNLEGHCQRNAGAITDKVKIDFYDGNDDLCKHLYSILSQLNPEETVILTCNADEKEVEKRLTDKTQLKIEDGKINGFLFTSWKKFKGLEKRNVVLVDFDPLAFIDRRNEIYFRHFYVGITRAQEQVYILSSFGNIRFEDVEGDENGEPVFGYNINTITREIEVEREEHPNIGVWTQDEEDLEKYGGKVTEITNNDELMQELGNELLKSNGECPLFAKTHGIPENILKEEYELWEGQESIRKLEKEKEIIFARMNGQFVDLLEDVVKKNDFNRFWSPLFATRKGIAVALNAESIFEPDILLEKMLSSFLTTRRKLDNTELSDNLKTKFYNDLLEMINFWEFVVGDQRYYDFKTVANAQDSISNVVDVLTHFLSLRSHADDYDNYFMTYNMEEQKKDMSWLAKTDVAKIHKDTCVNISALWGGFQNWSPKYDTDSGAESNNLGGKGFPDDFWKNFKVLSDFYFESLASVSKQGSSDEYVDTLSGLVMDDLQKYGWKREDIAYKESRHQNDLLLKQEIDVMENYLKTYRLFLSKPLSGVVRFEPAFAIKSILLSYLGGDGY